MILIFKLYPFLGQLFVFTIQIYTPHCLPEVIALVEACTSGLKCLYIFSRKLSLKKFQSRFHEASDKQK